MSLNMGTRLSPAKSGILALFSSCALWIICAWPGILSPDSIDTWTQIKTSNFSEWHPSIFQAYVFVFSFGGKSIGLYSTLQICLVSYTVFCLVSSLKASLTLNQKFWITALIVLTPFVGQMSMQMWKDVPFAAYTTLGMTLICQKLRKDHFSWTGLAVFLFGTSFRHDGILNLLIFAVFIIAFVFMKKKNEALFQLFKGPAGFKLVLFVVVFLIAIPATLSHLLSASPKPNWLDDTSFLHDLAYSYLKHPDNFSSSDRQSILQIVSGDSLQASSDCTRLDGMMFSNGFNPGKIQELSLDIKQIWFENFDTSWRDFLYVRWCSAKAYLPPPLSLWKNPISEGSSWRVEWLGWGIAPNNFGISQDPLIDSIARQFFWWRGAFGEFGGLIAWPGLHLTFLLIVGLYARKLFSNPLLFWFLLLWIFSRHSLFSLSGQGPGYRYVFNTHLLSLVTISIILIGKLYSSEKSKFERS